MATFRKRGPYQWQAKVRKKGQSIQTKTCKTRAVAEQRARAIEVEMDMGMFVSRAEPNTTTPNQLLDRYLAEVTPSKKGAEPETNRLWAFMRHALTRCFVAGICGVDLARFQNERLREHQLQSKGILCSLATYSRWQARNGGSTCITRYGAFKYHRIQRRGIDG